jgi:uncharacterized membrane protein YoaT (DUF817 family)
MKKVFKVMHFASTLVCALGMILNLPTRDLLMIMYISIQTFLYSLDNK